MSSCNAPGDKDEWLNIIPVVTCERSFDEERQAELSKIFDRGVEQLHRHTAEWQETVKHMRDNFVKLHPVDDADHPAVTADDVVVHSETIRTLFFEYPSDASDDHALSTERPPSTSTRYQARFDVFDFLPGLVTVTAELSAVVVRATRTSPSGQCCSARVTVPPGVERHRLRAFLSVDGVLTVEAPLVEGQRTTSANKDENAGTGSKWKRAKSALMKTGDKTCKGAKEQSDENTNTTEADGLGKKEADATASPADATSSAEGQTGAPSKEKVGVPIFRDELGTRRMYLAVELGTIYRPRDVIIQVTSNGFGLCRLFVI